MRILFPIYRQKKRPLETFVSKVKWGNLQDLFLLEIFTVVYLVVWATRIIIYNDKKDSLAGH